VIITRIIKETVAANQTTTQFNVIAVEPKDILPRNAEGVKVLFGVRKDTLWLNPKPTLCSTSTRYTHNKTRF